MALHSQLVSEYRAFRARKPGVALVKPSVLGTPATYDLPNVNHTYLRRDTHLCHETLHRQALRLTEGALVMKISLSIQLFRGASD